MKYFKLSEFDSKDLPGSGVNMDTSFLQMLENAREKAGIPFKINSGYRTEKENKRVKGSPKSKSSKGSSHMYGLAVDIHCNDDRSRQKIVTALISSGFRRIGIAQTFIHCDGDHIDKNPAIWLYNK